MIAKVWVDGELVAEDELDSAEVSEAMGDKHMALALAAEERGSVWMVEVSDPDGEIAPVRFGTDERGMRQPIPIPTANLVEAVDKLMSDRRGN